MKRLLLLLICFLPLQLLAGNPIDNDCSCKGIPLHGRVFITSDSGTEDFKITIRDIRLSAGANFVVCLTGSIMTMPGLPKVPAAVKMENE